MSDCGFKGRSEIAVGGCAHDSESLADYATSDEALEAARGRSVEPIMPRVVGEGEDQRVVLPGEPGYQD